VLELGLIWLIGGRLLFPVMGVSVLHYMTRFSEMRVMDYERSRRGKCCFDVLYICLSTDSCFKHRQNL